VRTIRDEIERLVLELIGSLDAETS